MERLEVKSFTSLPISVEAVQHAPGNTGGIIDWIHDNGGTATWRCKELVEGVCPGSTSPENHTLVIQTKEGDMDCPFGWWVIRGTIGEFYPCLDEVFQVKYKEDE